MNSEPQSSEVLVSESAVIDYLKAHPDFFVDKGDLLTELSIPHESGGAVSLIERKINNLQKKNQTLESQLNDLVIIANNNDEISNRIQDLFLDLMGATSLDALFTILQDRLQQDFAVDHVVIRILSQPNNKPARAEFVDAEDRALTCFKTFFNGATPLCGRLKGDQLAYLFADHADAINSSALIPFNDGDIKGMLAIGSKDHDRFKPDMASHFLTHLGKLLARAIRIITE